MLFSRALGSPGFSPLIETYADNCNFNVSFTESSLKVVSSCPPAPDLLVPVFF